MDDGFGNMPTRSDRHKKAAKPTRQEKKIQKKDKREHYKKEKTATKGFFIEQEIPEVEDVDSIWDDDPVGGEPLMVKPILAVILLLMLAVGGAWGGYTLVSNYVQSQEPKAAVLPGDLSDQEKEEILLENINLLVVGCDEREGETSARSDVVMVATLRPADKQIAVFSIPRDTYVTIPGRGKDKLNHSMAYGGIELTQETVEELLGIEIAHSVKINFDGFINVIDALGGVNLEVEKRMYKPLESIDLYPGEQTLMGKDALAYVRWRGDASGDFGRIERQQKFLAALTDKLKTMSLKQALGVVGAVMESISTDMSIKDMTTYGYQFLGIDASSVKTYSFTGEGMMIDGISYIKPDMTAIEQIVEYMQYGEPEPDPAALPEEQSPEGETDNRGTE